MIDVIGGHPRAGKDSVAITIHPVFLVRVLLFSSVIFK